MAQKNDFVIRIGGEAGEGVQSTGDLAVQVAARAGYYVRAIERGEVAEALLRQEEFDCLVVDLRMPDMRGDVLYLTACSVQPHLREHTVFTTGDASERATQLLRDCECPVVLQKPFDIDDLLDIVHAMTAHRVRRVAGE